MLYRSHFQSLEVQLALTRAGIPYSITSGLRFFEQAHIKDVAAFMKFVTNPTDEVAFKRMVRLLPGIAARTAEKLWEQINLASPETRTDVWRLAGRWKSSGQGTKNLGTAPSYSGRDRAREKTGYTLV